MPKQYDCIIVGGGPGGLLTAIYLARYKRKVLLIEDNRSRALLIPRSRNFPGSNKKGIPGTEILKMLRRQLSEYSVDCIKDTISTIQKYKTQFRLSGERKIYSAQHVVIATGLTVIEPDISKLTKQIRKACIRHCDICDGYEISNHSLAVLGYGKNCLNQIKFLLNYTRKITLFTLGTKNPLTLENQQYLLRHKVKIINCPLEKINFKKNKIKIYFDNKFITVNDIYSALGSKANTEILKNLKLKFSKDGFVKVDKNQQTSLKNLYAVGDVCKDLGQMAVAFGHAAVAATTIHSKLLK